MDKLNLIAEHIDKLKKEYSVFKDMMDYHVFTAMCIKYFFFSDTSPFDADNTSRCITDGKGDGGIDAIFNDPEGTNDTIIVQSKFYSSTPLKAGNIADELFKIEDTVDDLENHRHSKLPQDLVSKYTVAKDNMQDDGHIRVIFFTSYEPKDNKVRSKIEKNIRSHFKSLDIEIKFCSDITAQIKMVDTPAPYVKTGELTIDRSGNCLRYEDSAIVNISALSLQKLFGKEQNNLLGMNLRYFINNNAASKEVNKAIEQSLTNDPENFWYKNNGIIIVCRDFKIIDTTLELHDFSIVNGGQTTSMIGRGDIPQDVFLQCKVVRTKGSTEQEQDTFAHEIAKASNSQKPIKKEDLRANGPEQIRLRDRLLKVGIYYATKRGDKPSKALPKKYLQANIDTVGKICLAAVLLMPGSSRSSATKIMYNDEYYDTIFGEDAREGVIADALKIDWYYQQFKKQEHEDIDDIESQIIANGTTFQLACISFLCKIACKVFTIKEIRAARDDHDKLREILSKMDGMNRIISSSIPNEQEVFFEIFEIISRDVLKLRFDFASELAKEQDHKAISVSNFLKDNNNFYKAITKLLEVWNSKDRKLKELIQAVCCKK